MYLQYIQICITIVFAGKTVRSNEWVTTQWQKTIQLPVRYFIDLHPIAPDHRMGDRPHVYDIF